MMGKVARWLRMLGYDTFYNSSSTAKQLQELSQEEGRIIVTRSQHLRAKMKIILCQSDDLDTQLEEIARQEGLSFQLNIEKARCSLCNGSLEVGSPNDVQKQVPADVYKNVATFLRCSMCSHVYWEGSHWKNIRERIENVKKTLEKDG